MDQGNGCRFPPLDNMARIVILPTNDGLPVKGVNYATEVTHMFAARKGRSGSSTLTRDLHDQGQLYKTLTRHNQNQNSLYSLFLSSLTNKVRL